MRETNLRSLDLNLLVALEALLQERHVTRAAERVAMSQPAMSRALGRLRATFADPLLVRGGNALVLTTRGEELAGRVTRVLDDVRGLISDEPFVPERFQGRFTLLTVDYASLTLLPTVLNAVLGQAPDMGLDVRNAGDDWAERLQRAEADLCLGVVGDAPAGIYQRAVLEDGFACIMRAGHPVASAPLDMETFLAQRHALITTPGRGPSAVDAALAAQGHPPRTTTLRLPHFMAATAIIAGTDLLLTLPRRVAEHVSRHEAVVVREPPLALPRFTLRLLWHERSHHDPAHRWLRERVTAALPAP